MRKKYFKSGKGFTLLEIRKSKPNLPPAKPGLSLTGLTLIEILITMAILAGLLVGLLSVFIYCFDLQETSRNTAIVLNQARAKIEEIRNTGFSAIIAAYNGRTFALTGLTGIMRAEASYVNASNNNLIDVRVAACWRQKGGRVIGNATFSGANMTNCASSPVELVTAISNRQ